MPTPIDGTTSTKLAPVVQTALDATPAKRATMWRKLADSPVGERAGDVWGFVKDHKAVSAVGGLAGTTAFVVLLFKYDWFAKHVVPSITVTTSGAASVLLADEAMKTSPTPTSADSAPQKSIRRSTLAPPLQTRLPMISIEGAPMPLSTTLTNLPFEKTFRVLPERNENGNAFTRRRDEGADAGKRTTSESESVRSP